MLLVIPAIHIRDGRCIPEIDYFREHHLPPCQSPAEEPRLLRKENAKALHLFFDGEPAYSDRNIAIINQIRQCVDLPIGVTVEEKASLAELKRIIDSGIRRMFLKQWAEEEMLCGCISSFQAQGVAPYISIDNNILSRLPELKSIGLTRIVLRQDDLISPEQLVGIVQHACSLQLRITVVSKVLSYSHLMSLDHLTPTVDSVILNDTLEHDPFPCQAIWRQAEERAFLSTGTEANLWRNPLEDIVHL